MIDRGNWKLVQAYLKHRKEVDLISINSQRLEETWLRHLLEWAQSNTFDSAPKIRPTFPEYMLTARIEHSEKPLTPLYVRKIVRTSHNFFQWLRTHRRGFKTIDQAWLDTLKPPRMTIEYKDHEAVTIEEILAIAKAPVSTLREIRIQASSILWFLSGIRIGAFVTLPISAVDIENLSIKQWPKLGVKTKFQKQRNTFLLDIPELIEVVRKWDTTIKNIFPDHVNWFAPLSPETGEFDTAYTTTGNCRDDRARKDLKMWLEKVGLPYHSPHKFRHGFAVYSLKNAQNIKELKAISQNLMHSNISITDGIYGGLSDKDIKETISSLGKKSLSEENQIRELINQNKILIEMLKNKIG